VIDNSEGHRQYLLTVQKQVVDVCEAMLQEEIDLIRGARKLTGFHNQLFVQIDDDFLPIINFEAQTDEMPIGDQRQYYSEQFLTKMDKQFAEFEAKVKQEIFDACRKLIERFST
jgi:hypothetical protein